MADNGKNDTKPSSDISGHALAAGQAVVGTALDAIRFDPELMGGAYRHIAGSYDVLSTSLEQINNEHFSEYIGESGSFLKVDDLSARLDSTWHDAVDVKLDDFMAHYDEWSQVMGLANAEASDFSAEALATYGDEMLDPENYTGKTVASLSLALDFNRQRAVDSIIDGYDGNQHAWETSVSGLDEEQQKYLTQALTEKADKDYTRFVRAMESGDQERLKNLIVTLPPGEYEILNSKYNQETGAE